MGNISGLDFLVFFSHSQLERERTRGREKKINRKSCYFCRLHIWKTFRCILSVFPLLIFSYLSTIRYDQTNHLIIIWKGYILISCSTYFIQSIFAYHYIYTYIIRNHEKYCSSESTKTK